VSRIMAKRGQRGNYPCISIQPIFLNLLIVYEPSNFLIECSQSQSLNTCKRVGVSGHILLIECSQIQSLNTCKRVGVSGHIPELLGTWGLSTISLGKSVSQERKATREEIHMGWDNKFFSQSSLCMGRKERERKRAWSWCNHGGRILEHNWSELGAGK
jgi:hypothetical protein